MTTLDRYLARQFLTNAAALLVILFTFIIAIDVSLNLDRYLDAASVLLREQQRTDDAFSRALVCTYLVADLWWPRLLMLYNVMLGLVLIAAMGFTCGQLSRHRELVAALAGGVSLGRLARPIVAAALLLVGLQAANQELALPAVAPRLTRDQGDAGRHRMGAAAVPLTADGAGRVFYAVSFDADRAILRGLHVWERDQTGAVTRRITADSATWDGHAWQLVGGLAEQRQPGAPARIEPADSIVTDLEPTALRMRQHAGYSQNLSFAKLSEMLRQRDLLDDRTADELDRLRFGRFANMASSLSVLVLCLPFFLTRAPGNLLAQSIRCAPVAVITLIGSMLGAAAPVPGFPAAAAVFIPPVILALAALFATTTIRS